MLVLDTSTLNKLKTAKLQVGKYTSPACIQKPLTVKTYPKTLGPPDLSPEIPKLFRNKEHPHELLKGKAGIPGFVCKAPLARV